MMKKTALLLLSALTITTACERSTPPHLERADYWQRSDVTSAIYMRGPKAQQTLHKNIAGCTNEIRELQRLGSIRRATPADTHNGHVHNPRTPEGKLATWNSPERDGFLFAEHLDYHDFETCMLSKGWERVENLPHDVARESRTNYLETVYGHRYRSKTNQPSKSSYKAPSDFDNLND